MSNFELVFFLIGGLVLLSLTVWSMRVRDLESEGKAKTPFLFGVLFALFFFIVAGRIAQNLLELDEVQRGLAGLAASSFSAGAILMFLRAFHIRRSAT